MPGITQWQAQGFYAYFPARTSYPSILADFLTSAINPIGFSWLSSPACTGLPWLLRIIRKAQCFLEGSLCDDIMYGCAGDRAFLKKFRSTLPAFLAVVRDSRGDAAEVLHFLRDSASRE